MTNLHAPRLASSVTWVAVAYALMIDSAGRTVAAAEIALRKEPEERFHLIGSERARQLFGHFPLANPLKAWRKRGRG
jgi:hypothetical protein